MAFHLKHSDATLEKGVRRIARSQIRSALEEAADVTDLAETVHRVRRRCKKLRGLIRLVRPGLAGYGTKNALFRDAARALSDVRDADVLLESYDKLAAAEPTRLDRGATYTVRAHLVERRRAAQTDGVDLAERLGDVRATLAAALDEVDGWSVEGKEGGVLAGGLGAVVAKAVDCLDAVHKKPTPVRLHELRKQVKYYHAHVRLLRDLWPGPMKVLADEVERLGDLLGEERDLGVFVSTLQTSGLAPELTADVVALADERRETLHREAMILAGQVFADDPKTTTRRIEGLWKAWRRAPPASEPTEPVDEEAAAATADSRAERVEIERKFLVAGDGWRAAVRESVDIRQSYLARTDRFTIRVRIEDDARGMMAVKSSAPALTRSEIEFKIPLADAEALMALADGLTIHKRRYIVPVGGVDVEVDEFVSPEPSLVVAEVELDRPDAPVPVASWLGREVTGNPRYYGTSIAGVARTED